MLDDGEKLDEDSLLFGFFLTQKPRTVLDLSPKRRMVSSFAHTKDEENLPNPHILKRYFQPSFSLISHSEKFSYFGIKNYDPFMIIAQTR